MKKADSQALEIQKILDEEYSRVSIDSGPYRNIVGVFFHEILKHLSNIAILTESRFPHFQDMKFPFANDGYINNPQELHFGPPETEKVRPSRLLRQKLGRVLFWKPALALGDSISTDLKSFKKELGKHYRLIHETRTLLYLPDRQQQMGALERVLDRCLAVIQTKSQDMIKRNLKAHIERYLTDSPVRAAAGTLVIGTNANIRNRIQSANYLAEGAQVITMHHGEQNLFIYDLPYIGYGESSYCTDLITYGRFFKISELNHFITPAPRVRFRSSLPVNASYNGSTKVPFVPIKPETKCLYVPTAFYRNIRYGPFREDGDPAYLEFQKAVMASSLNPMYKKHPKEAVDLGAATPDKIVGGYLTKSQGDYDVYVVDIISTGSAMLMATDKPIIYMHRGHHNLCPEAVNDIKKRVFWYDVDHSKPYGPQIEDAINTYNARKKDFINLFTKKYSLAEGPEKSDAALVRDIIKSA